MFDLNKQKIEIKCPVCESKLIVNLSQVASEETISCSHCLGKINLKDSNKSAQKGIKDVNKAFSDLEKTLRGLSK